MTEIRAPHPPRQARSRASERRLLQAAREILGRRSYDQVSVAEIATKAGLTVGGFYSRFVSKEALLERLETEMFDETRAVSAGIAASAARGAGPVELLRELVTNHVRLYRKNGAVVRALVVRSRSDPALTEQLRELSRENYAVIAAALEASGQVRRVDLRPALEFALYAERSVLREAVLFGEGWAKERRWSDERIAAETVRLVAAYLGLAVPEAPGGRPPRSARRPPRRAGRKTPTSRSQGDPT